MTRLSMMLSLAVSPTFGVMALVAGASGTPDMLCSSTHGPSALGGMVPMYLLMSAFHVRPWLELLSG